MAVGRDAPWVGGDPPYERRVLNAWDAATDGAGSLARSPNAARRTAPSSTRSAFPPTASASR
jgi:hypothetical protein